MSLLLHSRTRTFIFMASSLGDRGERPTPLVRALAFAELSLYNAYNAKHDPSNQAINQYGNTNLKRIHKIALDYIVKDIIPYPTEPSADVIESFISDPLDNEEYQKRLSMSTQMNLFSVLEAFMKRYNFTNPEHIARVFGAIVAMWDPIEATHRELTRWGAAEKGLNGLSSYIQSHPTEYIVISTVMIRIQRQYLLFQLERIILEYRRNPQTMIDLLDKYLQDVPQDKREMLNVMKQLGINSESEFGQLGAYAKAIQEVFRDTIIQVDEDDNTSTRSEIHVKVFRHCANDVFDIYEFLNDIMRRYTSPGVQFVQLMHDEINSILARFPRWPTRFQWNDGIQAELPIHSNVAPWPASTLISSQVMRDYTIRPDFYQMLLCRRGSIASLLAALDGNYHSHSLTEEGNRRIDAYSVSLVILFRNKYNDRLYDASFESGTYTCLSIHARALDTAREAPSFKRNYDVYDGTHNILYHIDEKSNGNSTSQPFLVDALVFDRILPAYDPKNVPIMQFRVLRLTSDINEQPLESIANIQAINDANPSKTIHIVSQSEMNHSFGTRDFGNACTSFAMTIAMFLFNGYDKKLENRRPEDIAEMKEHIDAIYGRACDIAGVDRGEKTAFVDSMEFQKPINVPVQSIRILLPEARRSSRRFDHPHPLVTSIPNAHPQLLQEFYQKIGNVTESMLGLEFQEIWTMIHSPMMIDYDELKQAYRTRPLAIGITMKAIHSILIFVTEAVIYPLNLSASTARRYIIYDSLSGDMHIFNDLLLLEEFFVYHYDSHQRPYEEEGQLTAFLKSTREFGGFKRYFDTSVYCGGHDIQGIIDSQLHYVAGAHLIHDDLDIPKERQDDLLKTTIRLDYEIYKGKGLVLKQHNVQCLPPSKPLLIDPQDLLLSTSASAPVVVTRPTTTSPIKASDIVL